MKTETKGTRKNYIAVLFTDAELKLLKKYASDAGMTMGGYIRFKSLKPKI